MLITKQIPFSRADIDADWLTRVLQEAGLLRDATVLSFSHTVIGEETGFLGEVAILDLEYSAPQPACPQSLVLKIPSALKNRVFGQLMGVYELEIRFYSDLAPNLKIRTPRHYYSAMSKANDPHKVLQQLEQLNRMPLFLITLLGAIASFFVRLMPRRYVLLIENLKSYRLGDQSSVCSIEDAHLALNGMALLHAQYWESDEFESLPWITSVAGASKLVQSGYEQSYNKYIKANYDALSSRQRDMLQWVSDHGVEVMITLDGASRTLSHGDFRLDNICFDDEAQEIILLDWQTMQTGSCGIDLAYFLSAACPLGTSDETVNDHIEHYRQQLRAQNVEISKDRLRWLYELGMLKVLQTVVPLLFQDQIELGSDRGPALMKAWADKTLERLETVEFETILERQVD